MSIHKLIITWDDEVDNFEGYTLEEVSDSQNTEWLVDGERQGTLPFDSQGYFRDEAYVQGA